MKEKYERSSCFVAPKKAGSLMSRLWQYKLLLLQFIEFVCVAAITQLNFYIVSSFWKIININWEVIIALCYSNRAAVNFSAIDISNTYISSFWFFNIHINKQDVSNRIGENCKGYGTGVSDGYYIAVLTRIVNIDDT